MTRIGCIGAILSIIIIAMFLTAIVFRPLIFLYLGGIAAFVVWLVITNLLKDL